jgi:general stress protein YciG
MDPERRRAIARKGGQSVPRAKRSFSQSPSLAAESGRKGGQNVDPAKRTFSLDQELASEAGRRGAATTNAARRGDHSRGPRHGGPHRGLVDKLSNSHPHHGPARGIIPSKYEP